MWSTKMSSFLNDLDFKFTFLNLSELDTYFASIVLETKQKSILFFISMLRILLYIHSHVFFKM